MSSLKQDEDLAKLSIPQIIERVSELTIEYATEVERLNHEILIRIMQRAE